MTPSLIAGLALTFALAAAHAQLRIGQPSGFTGSVAAGVKENTEGARLYFDAVNARGGVHGEKIELISVDDKHAVKVLKDYGTIQPYWLGKVGCDLTKKNDHKQYT